MTRQEFVSAMQPLATNYHRELTRPLMTLFWSAFQHVRPDDFRDAVVRVMQEEPRYFPTVGTMAQALGMRATGSLTEAAVVLDALLKEAPHYNPRTGSYWAIADVMQAFGPQAVAAFLVAGGTTAFRDRTDKNIDFVRRDFLKGWETYTAQDAEQVRRVAGPRAQPAGLAPVSESLPRLLPGAMEQGDAFEEDGTNPRVSPEHRGGHGAGVGGLAGAFAPAHSPGDELRGSDHAHSGGPHGHQ